MSKNILDSDTNCYHCGPIRVIMSRKNKSLFIALIFLILPLAGCLSSDETSQDETEQIQAILDELNETITQSIPELRGSWTDPIHSSNPSRSNLFECESTEGWKSVDADVTVEVLQATGQNLFLMEAAPLVGPSSDCVWSNIDRMLNSIDNSSSSIQTMTVMADYYNPSQYHEIINQTRQKANSHSGLFGVTVDDFSQALMKPVNLSLGSGLTVSQVADLHNSANSPNQNLPAVDFMPYLPAEALPLYYGDDTLMFGTVGCNGECYLTNESLGVDGDFYIYPEDKLTLNATFATPSGFFGDQAELSFILQESLRNMPYTMDIVIEINGLEVGRHSMADSNGNDASITVMNVTTPELVEGELNNFGLRIDTNNTTVTKYLHKIAYLWDFKINAIGGMEYDLELSNIEHNATRGAVQGRPVYQLDSFVASNNSDWDISNSMDGVLFKFPSRIQHYDSDVHHRYVRAVCEIAHDKDTPCMEVFWANDQWTGDVVGSRDVPNLNSYINSASEFANGTIFWMLDLNLYERDLGKFSQRDSWTTGMETAVGFAASTSPTPGYYHRWYFSVPADGNYTILYNVKTNLDYGHIFHTIEVNGVRMIDHDANSTVAPVKNFVLERGDRLMVEVELVDGYSGNYYASEWAIYNQEGIEINFADAHHVSGVNDNTEYMYDQIVNRLRLWNLLLEA